MSLAIVFALIFPVLGPPARASAQSPGTTNPAARFSAWPDHELLIVHPPRLTGTQQLSIIEPGADLKTHTSLGSVDIAKANPQDATAAAAGRLLTSARDSVLYAYRYRPSPTSPDYVGLSFYQPAYSVPIHKLSDLAPRVNDGAHFFDLAVGDVDGQPADDSDYRDEAVVAWAHADASDGATDGKLQVAVAVLDFGRASESAPGTITATTAVAAPGLDAGAIAAGTIAPVDNALAVTLGDFDGDGVQEIAVAYFSSPTALTVQVFQYSLDLDGHTILRSLVSAGSTTVTLPAGTTWNQSLSLATGDFNGDRATGRDELALATSERTGTSQNIRLHLFSMSCADGAACSSSPALTITKHPTVTQLGDTISDGGMPRRVQIASGLFDMSSGNIRHRQLGVAYTVTEGSGRGGRLRLASMDAALGVTLGTPVSTLLVNSEQFWLAAGGFKGNRSSSDPLWSLAWSGWQPSDYVYMFFHPIAGGLVHMGTSGTPDPGTYVSPATSGVRAQLVAVDTDGDTMYLGAPIHMIMYDVVNMDFILQEPPKHAFWDPAAAQVVSVSRTPDFNITMSTKAGDVFSTTSRDTADWAIGGSLTASAKATVSGSTSVVIAKASAEASLEIEGKVGYDYQQHEADFGVDDSSREVSFSGSTNTDDYLIGRLQTLHIWRYRIYGMTLDSGESPFFEVVIPGDSTGLSGEQLDQLGVLQTAAGGMNFDWYQPMHENGNILSYPAPTTAVLNPADLGSYTIPCEPGTTGCVDGRKTVTELLLEPTVWYCDGNTGDWALTFSSKSGGGTERSSSHTLAENAAIRGSSSATVEVGLGKNKASMSTELKAEAEFHNSNSWGSAGTSEFSTSSSTGITLNRKGCNAENAYAYYPVLYQTADGAIKATFAVDPLGGQYGGAFWRDHYGQVPDLALNLPLRFHFSSISQWNTGNWVPTVSSTRKQMRGFFVRHNTPNSVTGVYDEYGGPVWDGDTVRLEARVYNYSVSQSVPAGVEARFDAVPYDYGSNRETGARFTIGTATLGALLPREMATAAILWDTTGMAGVASQMYRIYVVLDPKDQLENEKYETESQATQFYKTVDLTHPAGEYWTSCADLSPEEYAAKVCIDPGQNNEGFGFVTVAKPVVQAGPADGPGADISMEPDGISALDDDATLTSGSLRTPIGRPVEIRVTVHTDKPNAEYRQVIIFDGDPNAGGVAIAGKRVTLGSIAEEGNSAWFEWVPNSVGPHRLYAVVTEASDDPVPDNNVAVLDLDVHWLPTTTFLPQVPK